MLFRAAAVFLIVFMIWLLSEKVSNENTEEALKLGHRLVHGVGKDIEALQFNTAIAKMMEFINDLTKLSIYPKQVIKMATQALAPFAPHIAEEIWEQLGFKESLIDASFPLADERYLQDDIVTYVVQINGKVRGRLEMSVDKSQDQILEAAKLHSNIASHLEGQSIEKLIFVPNKLLNIVLKK